MIGVKIRWTSALDDALREMHAAGSAQEAIGAALEISPGSISRRMRALGIAPNHGCRRLWTPQEDDLLTLKFLGGMTVTEIALDVGKERNAVIGRIWRLKIKRDLRIAKENSRRAARNRGGKRSFVPKVITAKSAGEAQKLHWLRQRIYNMEPDSMRRVGEPIYVAKFL